MSDYHQPDYSEYMDESGKLTTAGEMTIQQGLAVLGESAWRNAEVHGFHESKRQYPEEIALFHSEISESFEAYRNTEPPLWFRTKSGDVSDLLFGEDNVPNKAEGMVAELADAIIRFADVARDRRWPLGKAVVNKHLYNLSRPFMHGKRL